MWDPLLQRQLVKERFRTQTKHRHTSRKVLMVVETQKSNVQLGSELGNVSLSSGSHPQGRHILLSTDVLGCTVIDEDKCWIRI